MEMAQEQIVKEFRRQCSLCVGAGPVAMRRILEEVLGADPWTAQTQPKAKLKRELNEAKTENRRLREALQEIAENLSPTPISIARRALEDKP